MEIVITSIALVLAGVGIGVLSGMLGIGGGTIMIPVLRLGYGLDAFMATATSLFAIIPISLAGAVTVIRLVCKSAVTVQPSGVSVMFSFTIFTAVNSTEAVPPGLSTIQTSRGK